jgi:hypothetical protein
MLQCPAHLSGVYEHRQTGDVLTLAVIVGPPGPVAVHTPEVCYSSREYTITDERQRVSVKGPHGDHTFWGLPLRANSLDASALRVLYGWSSGTIWEAADHPRFGYSGLPYLYKLQLAVTDQGKDATDFDPALDFVAEFLVQLQPRLVEASRTKAPLR